MNRFYSLTFTAQMGNHTKPHKIKHDFRGNVRGIKEWKQREHGLYSLHKDKDVSYLFIYIYTLKCRYPTAPTLLMWMTDNFIFLFHCMTAVPYSHQISLFTFVNGWARISWRLMQKSVRS